MCPLKKLVSLCEGMCYEWGSSGNQLRRVVWDDPVSHIHQKVSNNTEELLSFLNLLKV